MATVLLGLQLTQLQDQMKIFKETTEFAEHWHI